MAENGCRAGAGSCLPVVCRIKSMDGHSPRRFAGETVALASCRFHRARSNTSCQQPLKIRCAMGAGKSKHGTCIGSCENAPQATTSEVSSPTTRKGRAATSGKYGMNNGVVTRIFPSPSDACQLIENRTTGCWPSTSKGASDFQGVAVSRPTQHVLFQPRPQGPICKRSMATPMSKPSPDICHYCTVWC